MTRARAVPLNADLAEAHAGIGWNLVWHDWNWASAAAAFDRALALDPDEANARLGYSQPPTSIVLIYAGTRRAHDAGPARSALEASCRRPPGFQLSCAS